MTNRQKQKLQQAFFRKAGPNIEVFRRMFDLVPDTKFFIIDDRDRIITFNRQNLENGNFKNEMEVVGRTCAEIFPAPFAKVYMDRDREVRRTGKPIIERAYTHAADYSTDLRIASVFPLHDRRGKLIGTATVYRTKPCGGSIPDWYARIKGAVAFIDGHYSGKITLSQLAESSGLSQTLFSRLFKKTMQTTPIRYITEIRLNAARKLLSGTDKTLADIAAETGFYDEAHFVRTFGKSRGLTPGEYRRQHRASGH